jgi:hypothetical protein
MAYYEIREVVLLDIIMQPQDEEESKETLEIVKSNIQEQLNLLQAEKYGNYRGENKTEERNISIKDPGKRLYMRIANQRIDTKVILHEELGIEIDKILSKGESLFDGTAALKRHLVDIFVLLQTRKVNELMVFELTLPERTYDEKELFHNLKIEKSYKYINIFDDTHTRDFVVGQKEQTRNYRLQENICRLIDEYASNLARFWLLIYLSFVTAGFVLVLYIVLNDGWGQLEPWTFLLFVPLPYVLNTILVTLIGKGFSMKPLDLYNAIKDYQRKMLKDKYRD